MSVNLTKKQHNALMKGKNIRVKHSQMGDSDGMSLTLDGAGMKKYNSSMRNSKGMTITPDHIKGGSFKSVMKKVLKKSKPLAMDLLKTNRKYVDKGLKKVRERGEKEIEDILIGALGDKNKELIQDLVTSNSALLSKKASRQLDKLQGDVDTSMSEMGLVKNRDYAYLNPFDVDPEGLNLPVAVAEAIPMLKGEGVNRAIYLKGGSAKSFFKKVGKTLGKVVMSKPVKKILSQLAQQGVSAMVTSMTGSPVAGEMAKNLTGSLVDKGVDKLADKTGESMGGAMYMSGMKNRGGAMYMSGKGLILTPTSRATLSPTKLSQNDKLLYI